MPLDLPIDAGSAGYTPAYQPKVVIEAIDYSKPPSIQSVIECSKQACAKGRLSDELAAVNIPELLQERVICSLSASIKYAIPANVMLAIAEEEGGQPGQWVENKNGTQNVGAMQFNTAYIDELSNYGVTVDHVASQSCYAYDLAAWRIKQHIDNDTGDIWMRIANYHSTKPKQNQRYQASIMRRATVWADWLEARYPTKEAEVPVSNPKSPDSKENTSTDTQKTPKKDYVPRGVVVP